MPRKFKSKSRAPYPKPRSTPRRRLQGARRINNVLRMRRIDPVKLRARFVTFVKYLHEKEIRLAQIKAIEQKEVFTFDEEKIDRSKMERTVSILMAGSPSYNITDPGTVYTIIVASEHNFSSSAGGIVNVDLNFDPSTTTEWASLIALFSLVRIKEASCVVMRAVSTAVPTTTSVGAFRPIVVAMLRDDAGTPGSYAAINDSPNHKVYDYAFDSTRGGLTTSISYPGPSGEMPLWADTSTPSSTTLYQGCPGCMQMYGESMPVSTECLFVVRSLTLQFQNRI